MLDLPGDFQAFNSNLCNRTGGFALWKGSCPFPPPYTRSNLIRFSFIGSRAILSGPAGGVVGVSFTAFDPQMPVPVIGFDMGGTSTDVSRYAGQFAHAFDSVTAGITIQAPQLEM